MDKKIMDAYAAILNSELVPALGCTEPIAVAYAAAKAREVLGKMPESLIVDCSGNIIKNVKGVTVPNSDGMMGIAAAATLGAVGGDASRELEVLQPITADDIAEAKKLLDKSYCKCGLVEGVENLYIWVKAIAGSDSAIVELSTSHTHITKIEKNGEVIFSQDDMASSDNKLADKSLLNVKDIISYAEEADLSAVQETLEKQIKMNSAIADEGLANPWGAEVGRTLLEYYDKNDVRVRARARAAAGSDARMSGCALPVVINSGSGNQGMTVSLPVIEYAKELGSSHEELLRALIVANLIALLQKRYIGSLSAFCGAVCAATGAASGIVFLKGGRYPEISKTITNSLANTGGIVCDGAKPSCAAKIASAIDAAIMGAEMAEKGRTFNPGQGLVKKDVEGTVASIGRMGREGMKQTDIEILNIMLED